MTRHVLVTGGGGQVGLELARQDWPQDVVPHFPTRDALDLGNAESIAAAFAVHKWAAVINCAAYTAVDKAETEVGAAFLANAQGPAWLAEQCRNAGIPLIHVSTDYVFDGTADGFYDEAAPVGPTGVYGASKLAGELAVLSGNPRTVVMRTAWVVSAHRGNFVKTMLRVATAGNPLRVVADQRGCPTSAGDIARALLTILSAQLEREDAPTGTYQFVNAGEASWCEFARAIFAQSSERGGPTAEVTAITTADYPTPARRPANSRLSTTKLTADFGIVPRPWPEALANIMDELVRPVS